MNAIIGKLGFEAAVTPMRGFRIAPHDRLTIEGKSFKFLRQTGSNVELMPADGHGLTEQFPMAALGRLSAMGKVKHEVGYYLPDDRKPVPEVKYLDFCASDLPPKTRKRFYTRYAQVRAIKDMIAEGIVRNNADDLAAFREEIASRASAYMIKTADERDLLDHEISQGRLPDRIAKTTRKRRGGSIQGKIELYSPDYQRKLVAGYEKHGLPALADDLAKSGNRFSAFRREEWALLMATIQRSYLTLEAKSIALTVTDVCNAFEKKNEELAVQGLAPLRVPGRDAVRSAIAKLDRFKVMVARHGAAHAIKMLRPVVQGLTVSRPGERVEIDEWCIDLMSILHSEELEKVFGADFLEAVGLDKTKSRWWLVAAIDCRTKVILGMKLTRKPSASAARECLRMVVSDKCEWADAVGALTHWSPAVVPEQIVADNGPGFKSEVFTNACLDLQIAILRTIGGIPGMRGTVEGLFKTAAIDLMPRLMGRTFSNPLERGDYNAEERACLDAEGLAFALVRWVVDIYHNSPHEGLGGRTPLEQWEADMDDGNYPVRALPDTRSKRLAFGLQLKRNVSKTGITVMGIRYNSPDLAAYWLAPGSKQVDIRWDAEDLGAIEVCLDGAWREIGAVHEGFVGLHLHVWLKARRSLRARSASRKSWNEETVFKAIDDIEALVREKSAAFGILDTSISDEYLKHLEQSLFSSFEVASAKRLEADDGDLGRRVNPRSPDIERTPRTRKTAAKTKAVTEAPDVPASIEEADATQPAVSAPKPEAGSRKVWLPVDPEEDQ